MHQLGQPAGTCPSVIQQLLFGTTRLCTEPCPESLGSEVTGGFHGRELEAVSHHCPQEEVQVGAWLVGHQGTQVSVSEQRREGGKKKKGGRKK